MAASKSSAYDFIQETFSPMIAVATSPGVEEVCKKNNLEFVDMLKPFSKSTTEGHIKDPSGASVPVQPRVCFCDINSRPPPLNIARSYFNEALSSHLYDRTTTFTAGNISIDIPSNTPWFDAWRNTYLQVQYPSDHEFTKHYVGCLILVSSLDLSPVEHVAQMSQDVTDMISQNNNKLPKWFGPLPMIVITYMFLHDNSTSQSNMSVPAFEAMKATYGSERCFFLAINSQNPEHPAVHLPDPWLQYLDSAVCYKENQQEVETPIEVESAQEAGEKSNIQTPVIVHPLSPVVEDQSICFPSEELSNSEKKSACHGMLLSSDDIGRIVNFVNEFCTKTLIPHFEQMILLFTDQISNKKGVSRSLFSATKRWFGTNKPGAPGHQISPTAIAYSNDSHELQLRKLGDLCFMIGLYTLAYNAYHSAKRDFYVDAAWLYYAGALEMAALAAFMSDNPQLLKKMIEYAEESISTYQTSCRYSPFATRATLLSSECLKGKGLFGEAAKQLIRMSGEDSDLRSAVLLEQAAYCFLRSPRPVMCRKYAFHMVLAGNRYSKASHKNHSMRCYYQAYQVYESKNWSIAEDHILYTIGKHASQLKLTYNGFEAFSALVKRSSRQIPSQQTSYLKDYILSVQNMIADGEEGVLSIPAADGRLIQVILNVASDELREVGKIPASGIAYNKSTVGNYLHDSTWAKLEERLVDFASASNVLLFTPTVGMLTDRTANISPSAIVKGEPVGIRILLKNPLHIPVTISNVTLHTSYTPTASTNVDEYIPAISSIIPELTLQADSSKYVMLNMTPQCVGDLQITCLKYTLADSGSSVDGFQYLIPESQLKIHNGSKEADRRLAFTVIEKAPHLNVAFSGLKTQVFTGEILPMTIYLHNDGEMEISQVVMTWSENFELQPDETTGNKEGSVYNIGISLAPNERKEIHVKIHPCWLGTGGVQILNLLFYYGNKNLESKPRYRLIQHSWPIEVLGAYNIEASARMFRRLQMDNISANISLAFHASEKHQGHFQNIELYSIGLYSKWWKLSSTVYQPEDTTVKESEDIYILLETDKQRQPQLHLSSLPLTNQKITNAPSPFIPKPSDSFDLENDMMLTVNWKYVRVFEGVNETVFGQDYCKISINEEKPSSEQSFRFEQPKAITGICNDKVIDYRLLHDAFIEKKGSDFTYSRSLVMNVNLRLLNRSGDPQLVKVVADCSQLRSTTDLQSPRWNWQGKGLYEYTLEPYQDDSLFLEAEFYKRGTYNLLGGIIVMVKIGDEFITQKSAFNSSVIVVK